MGPRSRPSLLCPRFKSIKITRTKRSKDYGHSSELKIRSVLCPFSFMVTGTHTTRGTCSVVARNNNILKQLVLEAKREYEKDAEHRVHIYMADT